jgi:hypothetical protein
MKLSSYAEKLLERADTRPARPIAFAASGGPSAPSVPAVVIPPALAKYPARMKVREAAEYLGLSQQAVINLSDLGQIQFINVAAPGSSRPCYRIDRASLAAFEAQRTVRQ